MDSPEEGVSNAAWEVSYRISASDTVRCSCAEIEMAAAISTSSRASAGGIAGFATAFYGIEKGGCLPDERRRLVRKSAHLGTASVKNGNGILAGCVPGIRLNPSLRADKSRLGVGHALRADVAGRGRSKGPVCKADQGPAGLLMLT